MKLVVVAALSLLVVAVAFSGEKQQKGQCTPAFSKINSLAGTWKGKDEKGKSFTVSYTVVSGESAVLEGMNISASRDAKTLKFSFVDATNLSAPARRLHDGSGCDI